MAMTRRKLIRRGYHSALGLFLSSKMVHLDLISKVNAQEVDPKFLEHKILSFMFNGGANMWYWNLPMQPNGSNDKKAFNPMVITRYGDDIQGPGEYRSTKVGEFYMPEMWAGNIPTTTGSTAMTDIAQNMMVIRGIKLSNGGHVFGNTVQNEPIPGKSLLGLVADQSALPIPAVNSGLGYSSTKGIPAVGLGASALKAFNPPWYEQTITSVNDAVIEARIDEALLALKDANSGSKHRFIPSTYQQRISAKKLLKKDYSDLTDVFTQLTAKYNNLMQLAMHDSQYAVAGVEDRAIPGSQINAFNLSGSHYTGSDLRECFTDMTMMNDWAASFATAEFMITEGYSACFNASTGGFDNINKLNFTSGNGITNFDFDIHDTGSHIALLHYTKMYKAHSAMLNELISQLKLKTYDGGTMFDKTLVNTVSDFNRSARLDGTGADHGSDGTCYTIMSGKVPELTIIGDTTEYSDTDNAKWGGSWGVGANMDIIGGRPLVIGNAASTVCTMIGADLITPNDPSLVRMENNKIVSLLGRPKNW